MLTHSAGLSAFTPLDRSNKFTLTWANASGRDAARCRTGGLHGTLASVTLSETALALMISYTVVSPVHMTSVTTRGLHNGTQEPQVASHSLCPKLNTGLIDHSAGTSRGLSRKLTADHKMT